MTKPVLRFSFLLFITFSILPAFLLAQKNRVTIYPAPDGEVLSQEYVISASGQNIPVYVTKIAPADKERRWKAMDDKKNSADYFDIGAFAYLDLKGKATVQVTVPQQIKTARILPTSAGIVPVIKGNAISFSIKQPLNLTIEINGEFVKSLHLFVNPPEKEIPRQDDPNVIYYGPGIHRISHLVVGDNKTLYIAGGAVLKEVISPDEKFSISSYSGLKNYSSAIELRGHNITVRGRGIIDASECTTHSRNMITVKGSNIKLEGIILRDSPTWTIPVRESDSVWIDNIKLLGYRANSDGIDICNSHNVTVENCFIRTLDDLVVIKTPKGGKGETSHVIVKNCILWNQCAHALSIGAEITSNINDVLFTDCDVIHDQGREWSLRVYHTDAARVSNVRFENIRIEESHQFISLFIDKAVWSTDKEQGHIQGISFKNISAVGKTLTVNLKGYDEGHAIEDVSFRNVILNGKALTPDLIQQNAFVKNVTVQP